MAAKNTTPQEKAVPIRTLLREYVARKPGFPVQAILAAARRGDFPVKKSGNGPKARRYVRPSDLKKYVEALGWK